MNQNNANDDINNLLRRAMVLRDPQSGIAYNFYSIKREFKQMIYSSKCFALSSVFCILIFLIFYFSSRNMNITIETLESEEMSFIYFLIFLFVSIFSWNFYLFFSLVIARSEYIKLKSDSILTADLLYFNPILFTFMIFYYNRSFIQTSFDVFAWMMISSQYFINFCYSVHLYKFANYKISQITNFMSNTHKLLMWKIRINYTILIISNISLSYLLKIGIKDTEFMYKYFVLLKVKINNIGFLFILKTNRIFYY